MSSTPTEVAPTETAVPPLRQLGPLHEQISLSFGSGDVRHLTIFNNTAYFQMEKTIYAASRSGIETYLPSFEGRLIAIDDTVGAWIVAEDGSQISRYQAGHWDHFGAEAGWQTLDLSYGPPASQQKMVRDNERGLWLTTRTDIRRWQNDRWTVFTAEEMGFPLPDDPETERSVFTIAYMAQTNTIWVGQCNWLPPGPVGGQGVVVYNGQTWQSIVADTGRGCVSDIVNGPHGDMWFNLGSTLWQYDLGTTSWHSFQPPKLEHGYYGSLDALSISGDNYPFAAFAFCGGASCFGPVDSFLVDENGRFTQTERSDTGIPPVALVDGDGTQWLFQQGQLFKVVAGEAQFVSETIGVWPNNGVVDENGRIWVIGAIDGQVGLWRLED